MIKHIAHTIGSILHTLGLGRPKLMCGCLKCSQHERDARFRYLMRALRLTEQLRDAKLDLVDAQVERDRVLDTLARERCEHSCTRDELARLRAELALYSGLGGK